jgi:hypothetical protein
MAVVSDVHHPLEALPVAAVMQWAMRQEAPEPLRERIRAYIVHTRGETALPLVFRAGSLLRPRGLSLAELKSCDLTMRELIDDDAGIKASLAELKACGAVATMDDFLKLAPAAADVLGPFANKARHERLSMTALQAVFQTDVQHIAKDVFKLTAQSLLAQYGANLYPSDFGALLLRFDGKAMRAQAQLAEVRKLLPKGLFRAFPLTEWTTAAGLNDDYFAILVGTKDSQRIAELRRSIWLKKGQ